MPTGARPSRDLIGIFFTFAVAAYWIFEEGEGADTHPRSCETQEQTGHPRRGTAVEAKLGAFVRGQLHSDHLRRDTLRSPSGDRRQLLLGVFAGIIQIVPVVGPLMWCRTDPLAGLSVDVHTAVTTAVTVYGLRLIQDYVVGPGPRARGSGCHR